MAKPDNIPVHPRPRTRAIGTALPEEASENQLAQRKGWRRLPADVPDAPFVDSADDDKTGYGNPPREHQFKLGNPGGPGRPKGSKSQNTLLREELNRKHPTRVGGRTIKKSARELISTLLVSSALTSRDHRHLIQLNVIADRLFPDTVEEKDVIAANDPALDELVLRDFLAGLQLGDSGEGSVDPFADIATGRLDPEEDAEGDAWNEGNWDAAADGGQP